MTQFSTMVEQLVAADATAAAILVAVRAMECVTPVTPVTRDSNALSRVTKKREGNCNRQRRRRARLAAERLFLLEAQANDGAMAGVTVTRDSVTPHCESKKEEGLSIKVGKKKESKKVRSIEDTRAKGTRMEPGAALTEPLRQAALELGAFPEEIPGAWVEFVDFWIGVPGIRGLKSDWPATWRNRIRDILKRGNRNGTGTRDNRANSTAGRATAREAHDIATMGGAALRYLQEGKAAGIGRDTPGGASPAGEFDLGKRAENAR